MALKLSDVMIDPRSLGTSMLFAAAAEYYDYTDGVRSTTPSGIKVEVLLPEKAMERLAVKIPGATAFPKADPLAVVRFKDLSVTAYVVNGNVGFKATASAVEIKNNS